MLTELTPEQEKQVQERLKEQENKMIEEFNDRTWRNMSRMIKIMKEHFGEEVYQVVVKDAGEEARQHWSQIAEEAGDNSIEEFLKRQFTEENLATMEKTELGYQFKVTNCKMCEIAKRLGIEEQAFYFFCEPDPFAAEGFNPNIGFKRTKTLMQGDDCCDHFYYYKDKSKQS